MLLHLIPSVHTANGLWRGPAKTLPDACLRSRAILLKSSFSFRDP